MQKDKKQHPHKELIEMWANNTSLKFESRKVGNVNWHECNMPNGPRWNLDFEYRVKPELVDKYLFAYKTKDGLASVSNRYYTNIDDFKGSISFADRLEWAEIIVSSKHSMEA